MNQPVSDLLERVELNVDLDDVPKCEFRHHPIRGHCDVVAVARARDCRMSILVCATALDVIHQMNSSGKQCRHCGRFTAVCWKIRML